jgi:hypothetical protein
MKSTTNRKGFLLFLSLLLLNCSCLNRHFIDGRSELISVSDSSLQDSSLFFGNIYRIDWDLNYPFPGPVETWIDGTEYKMISDKGYYNFKVTPGNYSIKCQQKGNTWSRLIVEKKNIKIEKNKKIQINFFLGYTEE